MREAAKIVAQSGIVPEEVLAEFQRWGTALPEVAESGLEAGDASSLLEALPAALARENAVLIKETCVDALPQYLSTLCEGTLVLSHEGQVARIPVTYGVLVSGEYLLPWQSETVEQLMADGQAMLLRETGDYVPILSVRSLFYGDTKSFLACKTREERTDGRAAEGPAQ